MGRGGCCCCLFDGVKAAARKNRQRRRMGMLFGLAFSSSRPLLAPPRERRLERGAPEALCASLGKMERKRSERRGGMRALSTSCCLSQQE